MKKVNDLSFNTFLKFFFFSDRRGREILGNTLDLLQNDGFEKVLKCEGEDFEKFSLAVKELNLTKLSAKDLVGTGAENLVKALENLYLSSENISFLLIKENSGKLGAILKGAGFSDETVEKLLGEFCDSFSKLLGQSAVSSNVLYDKFVGQMVNFFENFGSSSLSEEISLYLMRFLKYSFQTSPSSFFRIMGYVKSFLDKRFGSGFFSSICYGAIVYYIARLSWRAFYAGIRAKEAWSKNEFRKYLATDVYFNSLLSMFGPLRSVVYPLFLKDYSMKVIRREKNAEKDAVVSVADKAETLKLWFGHIRDGAAFLWRISPPVVFFSTLRNTFSREFGSLFSFSVSGETEKELNDNWENSDYVRAMKAQEEDEKKGEDLQKEIDKQREGAAENSAEERIRIAKEKLRDLAKKYSEKALDLLETVDKLAARINETSKRRYYSELKKWYIEHNVFIKVMDCCNARLSVNEALYEGWEDDLATMLETAVRDVESDDAVNIFRNENIANLPADVIEGGFGYYNENNMTRFIKYFKDRGVAFGGVGQRNDQQGGHRGGRGGHRRGRGGYNSNNYYNNNY